MLDIAGISGRFGDIVVLWGQGQAQYSAPQTIGGFGVTRLVIADLNRDGREDIYYTSGPTGIALLNNGGRTFQEAFVGGYRATETLDQIYDSGDVDRDGLIEVVIAGIGQVYVMTFEPRDGNYGHFRTARTLLVPASAGTVASVRLADIDGDGYSDVLISTVSGAVPVLWSKNDGRGNFSEPATLVLGHAAGSNLLVDMDGDGADDLIAINRFNGSVDFANASSGKFASPFPDFSTFEKLADGTYVRRNKDGSFVTFNDTGRQTSSVDANGNTTRYDYDVAGSLLKSIDPSGGETLYAYSGGRLTSITDPAGKVTEFTVGISGGLEVMKQADGADQKFGYDANGLLTSNTDQNGGTTTAEYNDTAQLTKVVFADGASVKLDIAKSIGIGDLSGPAPAPENFVRPEDRVTTLQDARGKIIKVEVNEWGGLLRQLDPLGRLTKTTRNDRNLVTRIDAPSSVAVPAAAPGGGGLALATGPMAQNIKAVLETAGLVIKTAGDPFTPPVAQGFIATEFDYDTQGNVNEMREAAGTELQRITNYEYEPVHNRLVKKVEPVLPSGGTRKFLA